MFFILWKIIIIENKINAGDQENQLLDYYNDRYNGEKEIFLVYLTRWKYEASEYSISKETKELASYKHITKIEIRKTEFIKTTTKKIKR